MRDSSPPASRAPVIFISYRHDDGAGYTLLLHRELADYYGDEWIFIDTNIELGSDWVEVIEEALASCKAVVAVIGKQWLTITIDSKRRLEDPEDQLRFEIATALERNIKIFPVLVEGANMPAAKDLPAPLTKLARQQAIEVRRLSWKYDFGRLMTAIDDLLGAKSVQTISGNKPPGSGDSPPRRWKNPSILSANHLLKQFTRKGFGYWLRAIVLIGLGLLVGDRIGKQDIATHARSNVLQFLSKLRPASYSPQQTALVLIGDDEYWNGELEGRVPIKRDYLARVLKAVDEADPAVIALDFDLSSRTPKDNAVYQEENKFLMEAVKEISSRRTVVLPRSLGSDDESLVAEPDIYDGFDFATGRVQIGFTALPDDIRVLPLGVILKDGTRVNSFAEAIVRAYQPTALAGIRGTESIFPYATYLEGKYFQAIFANELLTNGNPGHQNALRSKIVIVGGVWHANGYGRGPRVASYETPVGQMPGAFIQANYVEAILGHRTYSPISSGYLVSIEVVLAMIVALVFALEIQPQLKLATIMVLSLLLVVSSYISWQTLDLLFSLWVPVVFLTGSLLADQIMEWRAFSRARLKEG